MLLGFNTFYHAHPFLSRRHANSKCNTECFFGLFSCRYRCDCEPGWTGKNCELDRNDCLPNPCQNAGTCTDQLNGFTCKCRQGFRGKSANRCSPASCQDNRKRKSWSRFLHENREGINVRLVSEIDYFALFVHAWWHSNADGSLFSYIIAFEGVFPLT